MTDSDLMTRAAAFDRDGRLVSWTPEAVANRMIEAFVVLDRTPMQIGPKGAQGYWPNVVMTWQDLIDEKDQQRLLAAYGEDVDYQDWVENHDPSTMRQLSRDRGKEITKRAERGAPDAAAYSRAEEAFRWPAVYLGAQPLLADAIGVWACSLAWRRSLVDVLKNRREVADLMLARFRVHPEVATARVPKLSARGGNPKTRQEVMPGKNFNESLTHERRRRAAAVICARLDEAAIVVDEASADLLRGIGR